jgi:hypothetical protein
MLMDKEFKEFWRGKPERWELCLAIAIYLIVHHIGSH